MQKVTLSLSLMLLLSGCIDLSPYQQSPAPVVGGGYSPIYSSSSQGHPAGDDSSKATMADRRAYNEKEPTGSDPVVIALLNESTVTQQRGDLSAAVSTLERGVRIKPRNPKLWAQLAELRLQQGKAVLAENLARKSLALIRSQTDRPLQAKNWRVIATSLRQQGRVKEARLAAQKAHLLLNN